MKWLLKALRIVGNIFSLGLYKWLKKRVGDERGSRKRGGDNNDNEDSKKNG